MPACRSSLIVTTALMFSVMIAVVAFNPVYPDISALSMPMTGFWPIMLGLITVECYSDPTGSRPCLCFRTKVPNRVYPFLMVGVFALIGGGIPYDLLSGALVGVLSEPASPRRRAAWPVPPAALPTLPRPAPPRPQ